MQDAVLKLKRNFGITQQAPPLAEDGPLLPPAAPRSDAPGGRNGEAAPPAVKPLPQWPGRGASGKRGPLASPAAPALHPLAAPTEVRLDNRRKGMTFITATLPQLFVMVEIQFAC